jgi:hypothetical protein
MEYGMTTLSSFLVTPSILQTQVILVQTQHFQRSQEHSKKGVTKNYYKNLNTEMEDMIKPDN